MELRIGVLGPGWIGREHIERINNRLRGGKVTAIFGNDRERREKFASLFGLKPFDSSEALISSPEIDAVVVTSLDTYHEEYVLQAIRHGKFVFCEKPLATTSEGCERIMEAEIAAGKKLVQVGFMRRCDKGYRQLKRMLDARTFGEPLLAHCCHRNPDISGVFNTAMVAENTMTHEIDAMRWLLGEDYATAQLILPKKASNARDDMHDPQILILSTTSGVHIDIEAFVRSGYGYDIKCEICCDRGAISLPEPSNPLVRTNFARSVEIANDWSVRFHDAFDAELQEWLDATRADEVVGPTAWDGYVTAKTAVTASKSRENGGTIERIELMERPALYMQ